MKHTENNEIDLLLRSLAKREGSRSASGTSSSARQTGAHLDADELNSFAEHTLPAATRARYMSHVVDCTLCRHLVTELTAAAGLPALKIQSEQKASSFWLSLGAFLSPSVLRYAVPALAILVVITVGVITLRQQNSPQFVAQNREAPLQSVPETRTDLSENAVTQSPTTGATNLALNSPERPITARDRQVNAGEKVGTGAAPTTTDSISGLMAKDAPKSSIVTDGQPATQPTFAPEPAPAPPAALQQKAATPAEASKNEVLAKQKEQPETGFLSRETRDERAAEDKEALSRSRKAAAAGRGGVGMQTMEARRSEAPANRADEESQTRAVEGRRFRRQGNVWVDTAYDGSRPTTTVVRGSEQYRALVADEPGIRLIAERLSGEVVLVWKGRAYRIR